MDGVRTQSLKTIRKVSLEQTHTKSVLEGYLCQNRGIISRKPDDESRGVPKLSSLDLNSLGKAARCVNGSGGAVDDATARGRGRGGGGLSRDEGCSKGKNGESDETEVHIGDGTGCEQEQQIHVS